MLRMYWTLKAQYLKTAMEYPLNFWMMVVAGILMRTVMMGVAYVLFRTMPLIAGFREGEVYLIMAFMFISEGLCNLLFDGVWHLPALIFGGQLDVLLVRPISPLFQLLSYEIGLQGIGILVLGLTCLGLALSSLGWLTLGALLLCLLCIVCGTSLRMSTYLIGSCNSFWIQTNGKNEIPYMMYSIGEYAKYPATIYPVWMQILLFSAIPFALIGYVPALLFRGEQVLGYGLLLVAGSAAYFLLARMLFYRGIQRYESAGM